MKFLCELQGHEASSSVMNYNPFYAKGGLYKITFKYYLTLLIVDAIEFDASNLYYTAQPLVVVAAGTVGHRWHGKLDLSRVTPPPPKMNKEDWTALPGMYTMSFLKLASKMGNIAISLWSEGLTFWSVYANRKAVICHEMN
ncbi:hypothetical protein ACJX0J_040369, partial [Zea mays]